MVAAAGALMGVGDVLAHSPAAPVRGAPNDPAAIGGGLDAPAIWAGERLDHVQAMRAAVGLPAPPGAAEVFDLDPDMIRVQLGTDGEVLGPAPGETGWRWRPVRMR